MGLYGAFWGKIGILVTWRYFIPKVDFGRLKSGVLKLCLESSIIFQIEFNAGRGGQNPCRASAASPCRQSRAKKSRIKRGDNLREVQKIFLLKGCVRNETFGSDGA